MSSLLPPSIFEQCLTREAAAAQAAQKGIAIIDSDTTAQIQAQILMWSVGMENPAKDSAFYTVLSDCDLEDCEVQDIYGMEKGRAYEAIILDKLLTIKVEREISREAEAAEKANAGWIVTSDFEIGTGNACAGQEW